MQISAFNIFHEGLRVKGSGRLGASIAHDRYTKFFLSFFLLFIYLIHGRNWPSNNIILVSGAVDWFTVYGNVLNPEFLAIKRHHIQGYNA